MTDTYTKCVLTIIATALVILAANNVTQTALAQVGLAKMQICDDQNCARMFPIRGNVQGKVGTIWALPVVSIQ